MSKTQSVDIALKGPYLGIMPQRITLFSGERVEAPGEPLDRRFVRYHAATQATMVLMAPHTSEA